MPVAIKIYEKFKLLEQSRKKSAMREISVLQKLKHPKILNLYDVIESAKQIYLVTELALGENLHTYLRRVLHNEDQTTLRKKPRRF